MVTFNFVKKLIFHQLLNIAGDHPILSTLSASRPMRWQWHLWHGTSALIQDFFHFFIFSNVNKGVVEILQASSLKTLFFFFQTDISNIKLKNVWLYLQHQYDDVLPFPQKWEREGNVEQFQIWINYVVVSGKNKGELRRERERNAQFSEQNMMI